MKVNIQVVDKKTGICQFGSIDEQVKEGLEIENALKHFGLSYGYIEWEFNNDTFKIGKVQGTTKVVSIIV